MKKTRDKTEHEDIEMQAYEHSINRNKSDLSNVQKEIIAALDADDKKGVVAGINKQTEEVLYNITDHLKGLYNLNAEMSIKDCSIRNALLIQEIMHEVNTTAIETAMEVMIRCTLGMLGGVMGKTVHSETINVDSDEKRKQMKKVQEIIAKMKG